MRDITYCTTMTCEDRSSCERAIENHNFQSETIGEFFSFADFKCKEIEEKQDNESTINS